jgi:hypothetical protein
MGIILNSILFKIILFLIYVLFTLLGIETLFIIIPILIYGLIIHNFYFSANKFKFILSLIFILSF